MKVTRTMGCQSNQEQQIMLLKSLLAIVGDRKDSENIWIFAEKSPFDAVIIDLDDSEHSQKTKGSTELHAIGMSRNEALLKDSHISITKPLRSRDLVVLLDTLDKKLGESHSGNACKVEEISESSGSVFQKDAPVFEGSDNRLKQIFDFLKGKSDNIVRVNFDDLHIYIDAKNGRFFLCSGFCYKQLSTSKNIAFSKEGINPAENVSVVSSADFFYEYSISKDNASLIADIDKNSVFHIKQWPQFMNMKNTKAIIKVSAYFSRKRACLEIASKELMIEVNQLVAYLNAAYAQGLLLSEPGPVELGKNMAMKNGEHESLTVSGVLPDQEKVKKSLFGRIRQRLGI